MFSTIAPDQRTPESDSHEHAARNGSTLRWFLNGLIVLLLPIIGFSAYLYFSPGPSPSQPKNASTISSPDVQPAPANAGQGHQSKPSRVVQLDVLNGCGIKGAGIKMTNMLRAGGFDVVEMKNYKSFHVAHTMVVDRIGDLAMAKRVAAALGIDPSNIVQQINPDYYVDVSVIIGKDYQDLNGTHQ